MGPWERMKLHMCSINSANVRERSTADVPALPTVDLRVFTTSEASFGVSATN